MIRIPWIHARNPHTGRFVGTRAVASGLAAVALLVGGAWALPSRAHPSHASTIDAVSPPPPTGFTSHDATANGVRLHYEIGGRGAPLVLIHGWPESWWEWHLVMPALAQHYTVIAPDLPGAGDSGRPAGGYDKKTMANDIYALVTGLGYARINLVGHDIGGMVAYAYAAQHPAAVRRLAILDVLVPDQSFTKFQLLPLSATKWPWWFAFHDVPGLAATLVSHDVPDYLNWFYDNRSYIPGALTAEDRAAYIRDYSAPGALTGGDQWYVTFLQDIKDNEVFGKTKLPMPLLLLGGVPARPGFKTVTALGYGPVMPAAYAPKAAHITAYTVQRAGHYLPDEQPTVVTQRFLAFFGAGAP